MNNGQHTNVGQATGKVCHQGKEEKSGGLEGIGFPFLISPTPSPPIPSTPQQRKKLRAKKKSGEKKEGKGI